LAGLRLQGLNLQMKILEVANIGITDPLNIMLIIGADDEKTVLGFQPVALIGCIVKPFCIGEG